MPQTNNTNGISGNLFHLALRAPALQAAFRLTRRNSCDLQVADSTNYEILEDPLPSSGSVSESMPKFWKPVQKTERIMHV